MLQKVERLSTSCNKVPHHIKGTGKWQQSCSVNFVGQIVNHLIFARGCELISRRGPHVTCINSQFRTHFVSCLCKAVKLQNVERQREGSFA